MSGFQFLDNLTIKFVSKGECKLDQFNKKEWEIVVSHLDKLFGWLKMAQHRWRDNKLNWSIHREHSHHGGATTSSIFWCTTRSILMSIVRFKLMENIHVWAALELHHHLQCMGGSVSVQNANLHGVW